MIDAHRRRFAELVRAEHVRLDLACLCIGAETDPGVDVDAALAALDALAALVAADAAGLGPHPAPRRVGEHLADTLGGAAGFAGSVADYGDLRSSLLHEVLTRRRGLPILLCLVWTEVARRVGLPAYGVGLPGHFVVAVGDPDGPVDERVLVDPFAAGAPLSFDQAHRLLGHRPTAADLRPCEPRAVVLRILANIRRWADGPHRARTRVWALELSLLLPGCPSTLRREYGQALARAGDFRGAAEQFETFASGVAEARPRLAEDALREAGRARSRLN